MKGRQFALFGLSLLAGLTGGFSLHKKQPARATTSPLFYAGTWQFVDPHNRRHHHLVISPNLDVAIDGRAIEVSVQQLDQHQLVFQDKFGYHLVIHANKQRPVSFFDEADDITYTVRALDQPHHA